MGRSAVSVLSVGRQARPTVTSTPAATAKTGKPGGLSPQTVSMIHGVISQVLSDAVRREFLTKNVAAQATPPRVEQKPIEVWDVATISRFLTGSRDNRRYPLWRLLFTTGMRRGEALGLRWDDLDLDGTPPTLTISRQLADVDWGKPTFAPPKNKKGRRLVLDPDTTEALRKLRTAQARERLLLGSGYLDHGLVFCFENGKPYHPDRVTKAFQEQTLKLGLPRVPLHHARHAVASHMLANGSPVNVVQRRLGHANAATTLGYYAHVMPGQDEAAATTVADLFG